MEDKISKIVQLLKKSQSIMLVTGAGLSADSGLPTYRGISGLYNDKVTEEGIPIEVALSGEMLQTRPEVTWKYLAQIEEKNRNAQFNRGHEVIAEMERHFKKVLVLTQNIDGFHLDAGSKNVIEIHGNLHLLICSKCQWKRSIHDFSGITIPPHCPQCKSVARPDVVFFGEMLPVEKLECLYSELQKGFDLYFSIGTTSIFPYIQQPIIDARNRNRPTVEINPSTTNLSDWVDIHLPLKAADALGRIWAAFQA